MLSNRTQLFVSSHLLLAANACSASLSPQSLTQRPKPTVSVLARSSHAVRRDAETTAQPRPMDPSLSHCYRAETSRGDSRDRTDQAGNQSGLLRKNEPYMVRLCVGEPPNVLYYGTLVLRVFLWSSPPHFERREKHRKEFCHRSTIL